MADTLNFLLLGLGVIALTVGGYIGMLVVRFRSSDKDLALLDRLEQEN